MEVNVKWREHAVPVAVRGGAIVLDCVWQAGRGRGAVIAPPHPEYGSRDHATLNEVAFALHLERHASLRLNWRGIEGSTGSFRGDWAELEEDFRAVLDHLFESQGRSLVAVGYDLGATVAARVAAGDTRIRSLLLIAPRPAHLETVDFTRVTQPTVVVTGELDTVSPPAELAAILARASARIEVVPDTDHAFRDRGLGALFTLTRNAVSS